jgi:hypothetical protein
MRLPAGMTTLRVGGGAVAAAGIALFVGL